MAPVTVIGLGAMGGALAGVLLARGHEVTASLRVGPPQCAVRLVGRDGGCAERRR